MSSVLAVKLVSGLRRKPKPSGRISSTPSANTCSPARARFLMMANISSCLRMRPVFSISSSSACFRTSDTWSALSSFKCMELPLAEFFLDLGEVVSEARKVPHEPGTRTARLQVADQRTKGIMQQKTIRRARPLRPRSHLCLCQLLVDKRRQLGLAHGADLGRGELAVL